MRSTNSSWPATEVPARTLPSYHLHPVIPTGNQQMRVLRADGAAARQGIEGTLLGDGCTGEIFPFDAGLAWAGLAADPFTADGIALARFLAGLAAGQYDPGLHVLDRQYL